MNTITVKELKARIDAGTAPRIIDVREGWEYEMDHITEEHIPMGEIPSRVEELSDSKEKELVICCRSGGRSGSITLFLNGQGFANVINLEGGMLAWKAEINPEFDVQ
jgi:rhodanese-related sulfurtransferase